MRDSESRPWSSSFKFRKGSSTAQLQMTGPSIRQRITLQSPGSETRSLVAPQRQAARLQRAGAAPTETCWRWSGAQTGCWHRIPGSEAAGPPSEATGRRCQLRRSSSRSAVYTKDSCTDAGIRSRRVGFLLLDWHISAGISSCVSIPCAPNTGACANSGTVLPAWRYGATGVCSLVLAWAMAAGHHKLEPHNRT